MQALEGGESRITGSEGAPENFLEGRKCAMSIGVVVRQVYTVVNRHKYELCCMQLYLIKVLF